MMLGPLKSNVEFADTLSHHLKSTTLKKKAQLIAISSKMVLFHANDLLDLRFLQTGNFTASFYLGSPSQAIREIVNLIQATLEGKDINIMLNVDRLDYCHPILKFDRRRLQQVLLNLLSNAIKF